MAATVVEARAVLECTGNGKMFESDLLASLRINRVTYHVVIDLFVNCAGVLGLDVHRLDWWQTLRLLILWARGRGITGS